MIFKIINTTQPQRVILQRCSRPLCSSQSTGGTQPHHQQNRQRPVPQDPTACRCDTRNPPPFQPPSEESGVLEEEPHPSHHVKCSTLEPQPGTFVLIWVLESPKRPRCSLERR